MVCLVRLNEETYHHYNRVVVKMCVFDVGGWGSQESACFLWIQCLGVIKVIGVLHGGDAFRGTGAALLLFPCSRCCLGHHGSLGSLILMPFHSHLETSFGVTWSFCIDLP